MGGGLGPLKVMGGELGPLKAIPVCAWNSHFAGLGNGTDLLGLGKRDQGPGG